MGNNKARIPWIMRLPQGLREQPAWVFIGLLIGSIGVTYVTGVADSSITRAVGEAGLRVWGSFLVFSGFGVVYATVRAKPALEKLTLRILSLCMFVYQGWLLTVVDWRRALMSCVLVLILISLAEVRVAVLKTLLRVVDKRKSLWL
jgi:hypothetical protein